MEKKGRDTNRDPEKPRLAASKRFSKYKREPGKIVREANVPDDETLKRLVRLWLDISESPERWIRQYHAMTFMDNAAEALRALQYSTEDVERFCIVLPQLVEEGSLEFGDKAGLFLSMLANEAEGNRFNLDLDSIGVPIKMLGWGNRKNIRASGICHRLLGTEMSSGSIELEGYGGESVGYRMRGGSILVRGDAGPAVGYDMEGGRITIEGDSIYSRQDKLYSRQSKHKFFDMHMIVGFGMKGGEIHINGGNTILSTPHIKGGRIYHKGKLIVEK
jgi:hypothetical protein